MQRILIPFIPAFYINQSELVLSRRQDVGEIRVLGVERVLEKLEVCEALSQNITEIKVLKKESSFVVQGQRNSYGLTLIKFTTSRGGAPRWGRGKEVVLQTNEGNLSSSQCQGVPRVRNLGHELCQSFFFFYQTTGLCKFLLLQILMAVISLFSAY